MLEHRKGTRCDHTRAWQLPLRLRYWRGLTGDRMVQDIAAIEARNNRLERQARHNAALMDSLERLLERLVLPEQTERILNTFTFNYGMCVIAAATSSSENLPAHEQDVTPRANLWGTVRCSLYNQGTAF